MSARNVYIGGLSDQMRERDLEDSFSKFGKISKVSLKYGYGFVEFDDPRDADDAIQRMNGTTLEGNKIIVEAANGGRQRALPPRRTSYRITVDNLPSNCNWRDLKDHLRAAGVPTFADVFSDGTGVVEFETYDDMKRAISKFDETEFQGKTIRLKEDRRYRRDSYRSRRSPRRRSPRRRSPRRRSRSPRRRSPSPRRRSRSPRRRSPRRRSRSPRRRSPSPRRRSRSPRRRSPSPRRRSPSPRRRSPSPRKHSPSPQRHSPSPRRRSLSPENNHPTSRSPRRSPSPEERREDSTHNGSPRD